MNGDASVDGALCTMRRLRLPREATVYAAGVRALYVAPVGLILLVVLWFFRSEDSSEATTSSSSSGAVMLGDAGLPLDAAMPAPLAPIEPHVRRRAQREVAELRAAIEAARATRVREATEELAGGGAPNGTSPSTSPTTGTVQVPPEEDAERLGRLDPQYIRDAIRDLQPLLRECYELALEDARSSGRETLEGRLVTRFVIGGEPDVGGVIEESSVMDESDLRHPLLEECFTETLFTVELPAPEEGGRVTVHYPFVFRAAEEE